jgi:hypothetical protein
MTTRQVWSYTLGIGQGLITPHQKKQKVMQCYAEPDVGGLFGIN